MVIAEPIREIDCIDATPALVIDLPVVERNVSRLAAYAHERGIALRPHTKTHKSRYMAQLQLDAGARGLTTAKVGEAEVMAEVCGDLLVAYPAIDAHRAQRLAELARQMTVRVALDSTEGVAALARAAKASGTTIGILIDIDVGAHRTGVQSPADSLALAQTVAGHGPSLRLDGIFFYPGHVWSPAAAQAEPLARIDALLSESIALWKRSGLEAAIVSGGSTPTAYQSHLLASQTEIRPGTYLYNDMNTVRAGFCMIADCAATIVCTVVSDAVPGKVVIDAGTKTLSSDRNILFPDSGHGHILEYPAARVICLSEEHGEVNVAACPHRPAVGERVTVIPNHICPCVNLQDRVWLRYDDGVLESLPVDTRGKLS